MYSAKGIGHKNMTATMSCLTPDKKEIKLDT